MSGRPFATDPIAEILADVPVGGMEDRSLARDYMVELASRVEKVVSFCLIDEVNFSSDLEHADPVVRALARGRVSAAEQVMRILDGGKS